jgi:hypothetical protein
MHLTRSRGPLMTGAVENPESPSRTGPAAIAALGSLACACMWVLVSLSLSGGSEIAFDVEGASYAGALTFPARLFGFDRLSGSGRSSVFIALMVVIACAYLSAAYISYRDSGRSVTVIVVTGFAVFAFLLLFAPPLLSGDVYSYAFHGRAMSVYHANPYLLTPATVPTDVFYPLIGWRNSPSLYGPVFNYMSWLVTRIAGGGVASNVLGFKALALAFYAGCLPMVYGLARRLAPGRENFALLVVAWSPILLFHTIGGAHNDAVMAFFVLAGFFAYREDKPFTGLILVVLGVMIKTTAVLALAPFVVWYLRDPLGRVSRRLAEIAVVVVVVPVLLYMPFLSGPGTFRSLYAFSGRSSYSSVPMLVSYLSYRALRLVGVSGESAADWTRFPVKFLFLALVVVVATGLLLRVKSYRSMVAGAAGIALAWCLTSSFVLPWYLALGLFVAVVAGWNPTTAALLASSVVFTMYRIPSSGVDLSHGLGSVFYLSVPLAVVLIAWLWVEKPFPVIHRGKRKVPDGQKH